LDPNMSATTIAPSRTATAPVWLATVLLVGLALVGAARIPDLVATAARAQTAVVASSVDTATGVVALAGYELLDGPTSEELGGVTHGIGGFVDSEHALVRVHLTLAGNGSRMSPQAFTLLQPDGTVRPPDASTIPAEELVDGGFVDSSLSFIVPRASGAYSLQVRDGDTVTELALGDVDAAPRPSEGHHSTPTAPHTH
jgi:hypothetical protein